MSFSDEYKYVIEEVIEAGLAGKRGPRDVKLLMLALEGMLTDDNRVAIERALNKEINSLGIVGSESMLCAIEELLVQLDQIKDCLNSREDWLKDLVDEVFETVYRKNNALSAIQAIEGITNEQLSMSGESVRGIANRLMNLAGDMRKSAWMRLEEDVEFLVEEFARKVAHDT